MERKNEKNSWAYKFSEETLKLHEKKAKHTTRKDFDSFSSI